MHCSGLQRGAQPGGSCWAACRGSRGGAAGQRASPRVKLDTPTPLLCPAAGADHTAGVTAGGALLTWGNGQQGQLGRVGERLSDRVKMETLLAPHAVPFKRAR